MRGAVLKILAGTTIAVAGLSATPAMASVTFNTVGSTLTCGAAVGCVGGGGGTTISGGGMTLSYFADLSSTINPPSNINLGAIQATGTGSFDATGALLTLLINQTVPGGSGSLPAGTLSGTITQTSSGITISWINPFVNINGYQYAISQNPLSIVPPNSCIVDLCGVTSIQGTIAAVPEPATWGLMLVGFAGVGMAMRRRRRPALAQVA